METTKPTTFRAITTSSITWKGICSNRRYFFCSFSIFSYILKKQHFYSPIRDAMLSNVEFWSKSVQFFIYRCSRRYFSQCYLRSWGMSIVNLVHHHYNFKKYTFIYDNKKNHHKWQSVMFLYKSCIKKYGSHHHFFSLLNFFNGDFYYGAPLTIGFNYACAWKDHHFCCMNNKKCYNIFHFAQARYSTFNEWRIFISERCEWKGNVKSFLIKIVHPSTIYFNKKCSNVKI